MAHYNGTLQWHPAMAPRPLPQSWSSPSPQTIANYNGALQPPPPTIAHYNGTLQWHPAMAPRPLPKVGRHPPPTTIAHYNGTQQWHHVHSPKVGRHPPLQWHPTMAQQWHRVLWPCNGTLVPRPIRQSGSSPSPRIGSKNPYSYRYLGNNRSTQVSAAKWI